MPDAFLLNLRGVTLDCRPFEGALREKGAHVMGILNVTPDSFSDGGRLAGVDDALREAERMLGEGAALLDIGGESTRPRGTVYGEGASVVDVNEEMRRVLPVIEAIRARFPEALLSIDTYKPEVAREALERGVHLVNDVTGLRLYPETAAVTAGFGAGLVVMHALGRPGEMPHAHRYGDVVEEVAASLRDSISVAEEAGVNSIVVDPGFGFGKTPLENLRLVNATGQFLELGRPVLLGISRKSTIGSVLGGDRGPVPVGERLYGTLGATAVGVLRGATLVRTHDVKPTVELLRVLTETAAA